MAVQKDGELNEKLDQKMLFEARTVVKMLRRVRTEERVQICCFSLETEMLKKRELWDLDREKLDKE